MRNSRSVFLIVDGKIMKNWEGTSDYGKHMEQQPRNIVPSEMSVEQINIRLTLIQSSERFGDGNVAAEIENGNLLKMLLRLDDLLNKSVKN